MASYAISSSLILVIYDNMINVAARPRGGEAAPEGGGDTSEAVATGGKVEPRPPTGRWGRGSRRQARGRVLSLPRRWSTVSPGGGRSLWEQDEEGPSGVIPTPRAPKLSPSA
jgi:hypothetical protein